MSDPWEIQNSSKGNNETQAQVEEVSSKTKDLEFEDNFVFDGHHHHQHQPLPDSASYLRGLERRLAKIKKGSKLVDALAEKRQDCMRTLLADDGGNIGTNVVNNNTCLELDTPITNGELQRHLQPIQPISVGEIVHIVKYDHLEEQQKTDDREFNSSEEEEENDISSLDKKKTVQR